MSDTPLVSVVVPTYNSGATIERCLSSIRAQSHDRTEIVVVDGYSTDATVGIADASDVEIAFTDAPRSGARNLGLRRASGEYLLSIDADMTLTDEVIPACLDAIAEDGVGGVIVPERSVGDSPWVAVRDFERQFYAGTAVESARFFETALAERVGGYDDDVVFFEESTLPERIRAAGYEVDRRVEAPIHHHEPDFSLCEWLRKKYRYGRTAHRYAEAYDPSARTDPLARLGIFLDRRDAFVDRPLLAGGTLLLKALEYAAASAGRIAAGLQREVGR